MADSCDVIVIGGGPAGCVTAMLLARYGFFVMILDKPGPSSFCIGETIPPQASQILSELGLFETFLAQGHRPSPGVVSIWGGCEPLATDFVFSPYGYGWHIDRLRFNQMLAEAAISNGVSLVKGVNIERCTKLERGWCLHFSSEEVNLTLKCHVIVDAGGRRRTGNFGFPHRTVFDRLIAVAGFSRPALKGHPSNYTLIEAVDEGWFYSALLPSESYVIAYMTDADIYAIGSRSSADFLERQLAKAIHTRDRIERLPDSLSWFCANTSIRDSVSQSDWIAVGDAARSYDPLCGAGLLTAMKTGCDAAQVIMDIIQGNYHSTVDYELANRAAFRRYRHVHRSYYQLERRWPDTQFWSRRSI